MLRQTDDGSVIDDQGRVVYFSCQRFVRDICNGDCCFICGAQRSSKPFNDEHVIPDWVLRRYNLSNKLISLPNGTTFRYSQYKIPCCADCNSLMGKTIETPTSELVAQGAEAVRDYIVQNGGLRFFVWMGLMFLKTHLKDRKLRLHRDHRKPSKVISDYYTWAELHHIHTVVRCFYTGCRIDPKVFGSFWVLPVRTETPAESFDFGDLHVAQTMLLRLGDVAFLTVFNDSGAALQALMPKVERISGLVSEIQLRELMIEFAFLNLHLKERPVYQSAFDARRNECTIVAKLPNYRELTELDFRVRGRLLRAALGKASIFAPGMTKKAFSAKLRSGKMSFLFDDDGKFITESVVKF